MVEKRYHVKVIRIRAEDSPNVRYAQAEISAGRKPSGRTLVPGILSHAELLHRRRTWDPIRQCIGLDAEFYEGAEVLLFPPNWLNRAETLADLYQSDPELLDWRRSLARVRALGVDPGEGGADSALVVVDGWGVLDLVSYQTPDTTRVLEEAQRLMRKWSVPADRVVFDRGGGGYQLACDLRAMGFSKVRAIGFGESLLPDARRGKTGPKARQEQREERYAYVNRRAQLYGELRLLLDPGREADEEATLGAIPGIWEALSGLAGGDRAGGRVLGASTGREDDQRVNGSVAEREQGNGATGRRGVRDHRGRFTPKGFAIPARFGELRRQLAPMPLLYDREGRLRMMSKNRTSPNSTEKTLTDLLGRSPDQADALVLAVHGLLHGATGPVTLGAG